MAEINYGESDAAKAAKAAAAFETSSGETLADINADIAKTSAEMEAAIVKGMSPQEQAALTQKLAALSDRAKAVIDASKGAYQFSIDQSKIAADEYATQMQAAQTAQRQLAGQAFGQLQAAPALGGYDRNIAEGSRAIKETAGAYMAALGGEGSVPVGLLPTMPGLITPGQQGTAGGLVGVSQGTSQLFNRALSASQARAFAELQGQQLALASQLEINAADAARAREEKEREEIRQYRTTALLNAQNIAAQIGKTRAELLAAAAGADTRTGKQRAEAELAAYDKKAAIDWKYTQKQIAAQAKAKGMSAEESAMQQYDLDASLGATSIPGQLFNNSLKYLSALPTDRTTGTLLGRDGKPLKIAGDRGTWTLDAGVLYYDIDGPTGKQPSRPVPMDQIVKKVNAKLGQIQSLPKNKQREAWDSFWSDTKVGLADPTQRRALAILVGSDDALNSSWYFDLLTKGTYGSGRTFTPAAEAAAKANQTKVTEQPKVIPGLPFKPAVTVQINPSAKPKDVSQAKNLIEASKLAEGGARQPERFALPNGVNVNVFTYNGKRYASPIGSTAEVYEWDDNKKALGKRV